MRDSLLLQSELAKEATRAHRENKEYSIDKALAREYLEKASESLDSEVFPLINLSSIETNKFDTDKRALWLFQDQAENYGRFLYNKPNNITKMPLLFDSQNHINEQSAPYANQLWLHWFPGGVGRSSLDGSCRYLDCNVWLRGVFPKTTEGGSQKSSQNLDEQIKRRLERIYQDLRKILGKD